MSNFDKMLRILTEMPFVGSEDKHYKIVLIATSKEM